MIAKRLTIAAAALAGMIGLAAPASAAPRALPPQFASLVPSTFHDVYTHQDVPLQGGAVAVAQCPAGEGQIAAGGGDGVAVASVTPTTDRDLRRRHDHGQTSGPGLDRGRGGDMRTGGPAQRIDLPDGIATAQAYRCGTLRPSARAAWLRSVAAATSPIGSGSRARRSRS